MQKPAKKLKNERTFGKKLAQKGLETSHEKHKNG